jgi:hypothetical protein
VLLERRRICRVLPRPRATRACSPSALAAAAAFATAGCRQHPQPPVWPGAREPACCRHQIVCALDGSQKGKLGRRRVDLKGYELFVVADGAGSFGDGGGMRSIEAPLQPRRLGTYTVRPRFTLSREWSTAACIISTSEVTALYSSCRGLCL